jgi:hypothetical protein
VCHFPEDIVHCSHPPYKERLIIWDASFLETSFYHLGNSIFCVLTYNVPE